MSSSESEQPIQAELQPSPTIANQEKEIQEEKKIQEEKQIKKEVKTDEGTKLVEEKKLFEEELVKERLIEEKEPVEDSTKEPVKQQNIELTKQPSKELVKQSSKELNKKSSLKKQPNKELAKQSQDEATKETTKEEQKGLRARYAKVFKLLKLFPLTFKLVRPHLFIILITYALRFVQSGMQILQPIYTGNIVDIVTRSKDLVDLKQLVINMIVFYVISTLIYRITGKISSKANSEFTISVKGDLYKNLLNQNMAFFDKLPPNTATESMVSGVSNLQQFYMNSMIQSLQHILCFIGRLWMMYITSPKLTLVIFVMTPIKFVLDFISMRTNSTYYEEWSKLSNEISALPTQAMQNIALVKSFSTEDKEHNELMEKQNKFALYKSSGQGGFWNMYMISEIVQKIQNIIIIWFGGSMAFEGLITPGELSTFNLYYVDLNGSLDYVNYTFKWCYEAFIKSEMVLQVLEEDSKHKPRSSKNIQKPNLKGCVSIRNICFSYPSKPGVEVLTNINVEVNAGEAVAFVGASGSGKTTLISLIQNLYDPAKGEIIIDEDPVYDYDQRWLHQQMGYVPQEPILLDKTIEENIAYGLDTWTPEQIDKALTLSNARFILNKKKFPDGLKTKIGPEGIKLSGGQKQRIAIARAFVKNPKILILDEPTSALDGESESKVQKAIDELISLGDRTVIVVAHRLSTIINCSKIVVFDDGRIVEVGSHRELIEKNGVYKKLFEFQMENMKKL